MDDAAAAEGARPMTRGGNRWFRLHRHRWDREPRLDPDAALGLLLARVQMSVYVGDKTCLDCGKSKKVYR